MLLSFISLKAQPQEVNYSKVSDHIFHNYHPDSVALSKFCRIGCLFIKFKIDPQGEVVNLSFSGDADSTTFIIDGLTKAVNSLKQDSELINKLKKSGRTIIQPFIYNYQAGCNFPKPASPGNGPVDNTNFYLSYMTFVGEMNHVSKSLFDILNFKDGDKLYLDNILLSPIGVGSGSME
jgi:hypothetical protein